MPATICPTITAYDPHEYRAQLNRITPFAERVHIDMMDGRFAGPLSIGLSETYWPDGLQIDLHLMYQEPAYALDDVLELKPTLVIVHAEADGDFGRWAAALHQAGIQVGVALLPVTPVDAIAPALPVIDHVLIFSGNLGHQGGSTADLRLLSKARRLRELKPELEIGWDGGINGKNASEIERGGVDVLNVGGYIQHAIDPARAYATLKKLT